MVVAAAAVAGTAISAGAAYAGSQAQAGAAEDAANAQRDQYMRNRADLEPYREIGKSALYMLGGITGAGHGRILEPDEIRANYDNFYAGFGESPDYRFAFDEGQKALDKSASARGRLQSGGYGRELVRYGQGMASQQFDKYANRLASLAGIGQTATTQGAVLGQRTAENVGSALQDAGTARASGYTGMANAVNSGISNYFGAGGAM